MKKIIATVLSGMLALSLAACAGSGTPAAGSAGFTPGTYEAQADGFAGSEKPVQVKVTFSEDEITAIEYVAE